ncbi:MAG: hypothetical protein BWK78_04225 [Thiotrichaceae bacterium IS1]|nr:MAG: hypothetical protein BWK78_04225 [Thiotrichaceae bacterium IS1]
MSFGLPINYYDGDGWATKNNEFGVQNSFRLWKRNQFRTPITQNNEFGWLGAEKPSPIYIGEETNQLT